MINKIAIQNFKSLRDICILPKRLKLLAGLNSAGKSSLLQALLMVRQSYFRDKKLNKLFINGDLEELGHTDDIFYQGASSDECLSIYFKDEVFEVNLHNHYTTAKETFYNNSTLNTNNDKISLFNNNFHYLNANHILPKSAYKTINVEDNMINLLGNYGENAPYYLARYGAKKISNDKLHNTTAKSHSISHEVDAWMCKVSPSTKIIATEMQDIGLTKVTIQTQTSDGFSNEFSPKNAGFGIPYALPLILTLLISKPDDLVLIENPESHLHPNGQAEVGRLIATAALSGVQIFCETHSDHIINGIRIAIKEKITSSEDIKVFYFQKNKNNVLETQVDTIPLDKNGELDHYPVGLLDEWGDLMSKLF